MDSPKLTNQAHPDPSTFDLQRTADDQTALPRHTAGPWTFQDDSTFSTLGDKRLVAASRISPGIVFGGIAETEANAHLIASAPDLYEALSLCATELYWLKQQVKARDGGSVDRAHQAALAALRKAEGR